MEELPDSTDWIKTSLPLFEPLEASLRCEVCKEFYENPVITTCSHTFCSLCIRRCISSDGKCPSCKNGCSAERLLPNFAVREIVNKFQAARPGALQLARESQDDDTEATNGRKRKVEEANIEDGENTRRTRSRITRSTSRRSAEATDLPIVIPDSEDEGDEEFIPDGMVACPMCSTPMKEEQVWSHTNICTGVKKSAGERSSRSKTTNTAPIPIQPLRKVDSPAPSKLPGLNYTLMSEKALRKKLTELGIPTWGIKSILQRRHQEWQLLWNSNCDASEERRKSKQQLLRELDAWERLEGGLAKTAESKFMKKDFDGKDHANTHKSQFDELIANAKKKRAPPKEEDKKEGIPETESQNYVPENEIPKHESEAVDQHGVNPARPYEGNEAALTNIRQKVEETNRNGATVMPPLNNEAALLSKPDTEAEAACEGDIGIHDPFALPDRKVPMFSVPEEPVVDVDTSTTVQ